MNAVNRPQITPEFEGYLYPVHCDFRVSSVFGAKLLLCKAKHPFLDIAILSQEYEPELEPEPEWTRVHIRTRIICRLRL